MSIITKTEQIVETHFNDFFNGFIKHEDLSNSKIKATPKPFWTQHQNEVYQILVNIYNKYVAGRQLYSFNDVNFFKLLLERLTTYSDELFETHNDQPCLILSNWSIHTEEYILDNFKNVDEAISSCFIYLFFNVYINTFRYNDIMYSYNVCYHMEDIDDDNSYVDALQILNDPVELKQYLD